MYDGDNLVQTVNSSGDLVAHYAQSQNTDQPLAMQRGTATDYYEADGLDSITSLTAANGSIAQSYTYDSFGNTTNSSGSLTNFFRYTGRKFDTETGLYYYRARYYDSTTGRFLGEDPLGFSAALSFYSYVGQDPVGYADPFGQIRYNKPPPITVPVTGQTLADLNCLEHCLRCVTNNPNLNLLVTGGAEKSGHKGNSFHYIDQAVDISFWEPRHNVPSIPIR